MPSQHNESVITEDVSTFTEARLASTIASLGEFIDSYGDPGKDDEYWVMLWNGMEQLRDELSRRTNR